MRLKASYVVENAVIIPLFVMIIVAIVFLDFYIHDIVILKSTAFKLGIMTELEQSNQAGFDFDEKEMKKLMEQWERRGSDYLKAKTIAAKKTFAAVSDDLANIEVDCTGRSPRMTSFATDIVELDISSAIYKNRPDEYVRKINAIREVLP